MKLRQNKPDDEIPTSSMADIAFLLIIYFMVTTTFAATRGLDFSLPKDDDQPPVVEKEDSVLVEVLPNGDLLVDQKPMELTEVLDYLQPKLENNPKKPVIDPVGKDVNVPIPASVRDQYRRFIYDTPRAVEHLQVAPRIP